MGLWSEWHFTTKEIGGWINNHEPDRASDYESITNPRVVYCHSDHRPMPSRFYIIPFDVNLSTDISVFNPIITSHYYFAACCWLCATMVALVFWIVCTRSGCTYCHIYCCEVLKSCKQYHAQMKNEIMSDIQSDHVTFVWTWHRSKQRLWSRRAFHPFIQHHDADTLYRRTLRSPEATLLKTAAWYGLSGVEFLVTGQRCVQNATRARLFAKCTTHLKPQHWGNPGLSQQLSYTRTTQHLFFSSLQKWYT